MLSDYDPMLHSTEIGVARIMMSHHSMRLTLQHRLREGPNLFDVKNLGPNEMPLSFSEEEEPAPSRPFPTLRAS